MTRSSSAAYPAYLEFFISAESITVYVIIARAFAPGGLFSIAGFDPGAWPRR